MMKKKKNKKKLNKMQRKILLACGIIAIIISVLLVVILTSGKGRISPNPLLDLDKNIACGVDISEHNGELDWQALKEQVDFVIVRVGYTGYGTGEILIDKNVEQNLQSANEYGIPVGVYFYTQAINADEARAEAKATLHIIKDYDISLPVFFDFEYPSENGELVGRLAQANLTPEENTQIINVFCKMVENAGYQSGVYASSSVFENRIKTRGLNDSSYIWVADYNSIVTYTGQYDIWQYSETGRLDGVSDKDIDLDNWYIKKG